MTRCTERSFSAHLLGCVLALALAACSAPGPRRSALGPAAAASSTATAPTAVATPSADKGDPDARFQDALALMKARRYPEAQAAFLALTTDFPDLSGPLTDLGILYAQSRQTALALASFTRAVKANPGNAVAHNWLGTLRRESGDVAGAEQDYRRAIAARPDYAPAYLNLAILYDVALRRPREALAAYQEYQRRAGQEDLIVAAWIRDLEARMQPAPDVRTASAQGVAR
jgi:tetratricopeptide (TPR) repeat protein